MSKRFWIAAAILASVLANTGCVTCCHKGYEKSLEAGPECDLPPPCRGVVHVFMMHGLTPSTESGLDALRIKLGENGFSKVGIGHLCHAGWVQREIACIQQHDPDARFVLLGYDYGAAPAVALTRELTAKGIPVEALVLLDPMGCSMEPCGTNTILITSAKASSSVPHSAKVVVPDATHFGLPTHRTTVSVLTELMKDIAVQYWQPPVEEVPVWSYPHAPEARRVPAQKPGAWDFLADKPGTAQPIGGTQVVAQPPAPPAIPVAVKR